MSWRPGGRPEAPSGDRRHLGPPLRRSASRQCPRRWFFLRGHLRNHPVVVATRRYAHHCRDSAIGQAHHRPELRHEAHHIRVARIRWLSGISIVGGAYDVGGQDRETVDGIPVTDQEFMALVRRIEAHAPEREPDPLWGEEA